MRAPSTASADGDLDDESASMAVVRAVANRRDASSTELPPLYEWIDPNALDALFEPTRTRGGRRGRVSFEYDGHRIVVERADGVSVTVDGSTEIEAAETADADESWTDA